MSLRLSGHQQHPEARGAQQQLVLLQVGSTAVLVQADCLHLDLMEETVSKTEQLARPWLWFEELNLNGLGLKKRIFYMNFLKN